MSTESVNLRRPLVIFRWRLAPNWPSLPRLLPIPIIQLPVYYPTNDIPFHENEPPTTEVREREPTTPPPPTHPLPKPEKLIQRRPKNLNVQEIPQHSSRYIIEKIIKAPLRYLLKYPVAEARSVVKPIDESTILLAPSAKAIAGEGGTAIAAPLARAIIPPNTRATVIFHPDSVAIAGPGGRAHAHADLEIYSYH